MSKVNQRFGKSAMHGKKSPVKFQPSRPVSNDTPCHCAQHRVRRRPHRVPGVSLRGPLRTHDHAPRVRRLPLGQRRHQRVHLPGHDEDEDAGDVG